MSSVKVGDIDIHYETWGSGQPVVFIHGAYLSTKEWVYQAAYFSKHYQVVLIDMPGHGGSDNLAEYSVEAMAEYIAKAMDCLNVTSCMLCGHSLGGMVAQALAIKYPHLVSRLILGETSFGVKSNPVEAFFTALSTSVLKHVSVEKQSVMYANQLGRQSNETKDYIISEIIKYQSNHENFNRIWGATVSYDGKAKLASISCPALIVVGENNIQTHGQAVVMKSLIEDCELVYVKNAGHMVNMDNPDGFNRAVSEFIERPAD